MQVETLFESVWFQRLKLKHDTLLSCFAFDFNVRPYSWDNKARTLPRPFAHGFMTSSRMLQAVVLVNCVSFLTEVGPGRNTSKRPSKYYFKPSFLV